MAMSPISDPKEIEDLLPWYAAGTLDSAQKAEVEAALVAHPHLRDQIALAREEMDETVHLAEALGVPSSRSLEDLFAKIEAEPVRRPSLKRRFFDLGGRLADRLSPRTLGWAATVAGILAAVQLGLLVSPLQQGGGSYSTANLESEKAGSGTFVLVVFQPDTSMSAINGLLDGMKATIVDGPRAGGFYKLSISSAVLATDDAKRISDALAANKAIVRMILPSSD
jgi:hypothetical protein